MLHQEEEKTTAEAPKVRIELKPATAPRSRRPFENFEGTVEEVIEGRGLVKVMLIIFDRPTPVDLENWQVERILPSWSLVRPTQTELRRWRDHRPRIGTTHDRRGTTN